MRPPVRQPPFSPTDRSALAVGWWLAAYATAVVYGTLYPWSGWRAPGGGMLGFASEPWPRWWTGFDVVTNVLVYLPLGLLLTAWLARRLSLAAAAAPAAIVLSAAASFALESVQSLLPSRVPSLMDVVANVAGSGAGAWIAVWLGRDRLERWPRALHEAAALSARATPGLLLLCAWPIVQWYPQSMVFATGDLFLAWPRTPGEPWPWWSSLLLPTQYEPFAESAAVALTVVAIGSIARDLLRPRHDTSAWQAFWPVALPIAAASLIKTAAAAALMGPPNAFGWLDAAAQGGLVAGAAALLLVGAAGARARLWLAIVALAAATLLFNIAPPNEYYLWMSAHWGGAWTNFHALLRAFATIWPFAALAWCAWRLRRLRAR